MRTLAIQAAEAAKSSGTLIESAVSGVAEGVTQLGASSREFTAIARTVREVGELLTAITRATAEQAGNLREMGAGLPSLDATTQRTAASAEEIAGSAQELSAHADSLLQVVESIHQLVAGRSATFQGGTPPSGNRAAQAPDSQVALS